MTEAPLDVYSWQQAQMACSRDRYAATVREVAPATRAARLSNCGFHGHPAVAITALPPGGGKIFVKANTYPIKTTIQIRTSNVHIQGEGMGITNFVADGTTMTASPALQVNNPAVGTPLALLADTQKGNTTVTLSPGNAATLTAGDYIQLYSEKAVDAAISIKHATLARSSRSSRWIRRPA